MAAHAREAEENAFAEWHQRYDLLKGTIGLIKLELWVPSPPATWVRIRPSEITGRRIG